MPIRFLNKVGVLAEIENYPPAAGVGVIKGGVFMRTDERVLSLGDMQILPQHTIAYFAGQNAGSYGIAPTGGDAGTLSIAGTASKSVQTDNVYCDFLSNAVASAQAGWRSVFTLFQRQVDIDFQTIIRSPDVLSSVRFWVGITSVQCADLDTNGGHCALFRYSTVAGDTSFTPITRDGVTQNQGTPIGTIAAATAYLLRIRTVLAGTPTVYFSVNGGVEQAVTLNLPGLTQDLGPDHRVIAQAASARNFKLARTLITFGTPVGY